MLSRQAVKVRKVTSTKGGKKTPKSSSSASTPKNARVAPAAQGEVLKTAQPRTKSDSTGITVHHREYVMNIKSSTGDADFCVESIPLNPKNSAAFPWLARIATCYETYTFKRLEVSYHPSCPTTNGGAILLAIDFDVGDAVPISKAQMLTYKGAVRCPVWADATLQAAQSDLQKFKIHWNQGGDNPSDTDRTESFGRLIIARDSLTNSAGARLNAMAGELWVDYEVALQTPHIPISPGSTYNSFSGVTNTDILGGVAKVLAENGEAVVRYDPAAPAKLTFLKDFEGEMALLHNATSFQTGAYRTWAHTSDAIVELKEELNTLAEVMYGGAVAGLKTAVRVVASKGSEILIQQFATYVGTLSAWLWTTHAARHSLASPLIAGGPASASSLPQPGSFILPNGLRGFTTGPIVREGPRILSSFKVQEFKYWIKDRRTWETFSAASPSGVSGY